MNLLLFTLLFNGVSSFIYNIPTKIYNREFKNIGNYKIIEPFDCNKKETPSLIFFSGARGLIPNEIYTNFINYVASNKISCCIYNGNFDKINTMIDILNNEYANITVSGHSSGGNRAIKLLETNDIVKNGILFDPVDDRLFFDNKIEYLFKKDEENNFKLTNKNNLLFVRAKKSYEWNVYPPSVPFIPFFDIKPENVIIENNEIVDKYYDEQYVIENNQPVIIRTEKTSKLNSNKYMIEIEKFGHCDILDKYWSDLAHDSICKGYENRKSDIIDSYHMLNSFLVKEVCYNNLVNLNDNLKNIDNSKEFNYNIQKY